MASQGDEEEQKLLDKDVKNYKAAEADGTETLTKRVRSLIHRGTVEDAMTYHVNDLSTWGSLVLLSKTVWQRRTLWTMFLKLFLLSLIVAVLVVLIVQDPAQLKVSKFTEISQFLNAFVGLLLGFFMSASVQRWWACADGFLVVFDAIRNLQVQLYALGVPEEKLDTCLRYGVLSAWVLNMELHIEALPDDEKDEENENMWRTLKDGTGLGDGHFTSMTDAEWTTLQEVEDPSGLLWLWVGCLIGSMSEAGDVPPMASPTYGRIMNLAQEAHKGMRSVRSSISVQAPFIYVQMLASLVHINNIINALSFGMTWGASAGTTLSLWHMSLYNSKATRTEAARDSQTLLVSFFFSCFGPFIYQALLEVSIAIAQPFNSNDGEVPTRRLLHRLERDLHDGKLMAHSTQKIGWPLPKFAKK